MDIVAELVPVAVLESGAPGAGLNATGFPLCPVAVVRRHKLEHELADQFGWPVAEDFLPRGIGVTDSPGLVDHEDGIRKAVGQRDRAHLFENFHALPLSIWTAKEEWPAYRGPSWSKVAACALMATTPVARLAPEDSSGPRLHGMLTL